MSGGRSDASTSTDDVKGRPLCLFYFTHPFGVLSPEPPTLAAAPPHIAQAFLNMQPVSPFFWSSAATASATATTTAASDDLYQSSSDSTTLNYDIGNTTVHRDPVSVVSVTRTRTRKCTVDFPSRRDSLSSSLFSSDIWFNSTCSSKSNEYPRRVVPYNRILPPLRLPSPRDLLEYSSDDVWPRKCLNPEKFSLPPIELPVGMAEVTDAGAGAGAVHVRLALEELSSSVESVSVRSVRRAGGRGRGRLRLGVDKQRRQRGVDVRRMISCLMRRAIRGGTECSGSPALQRVLHTIRDAWAEPSTLWDRCRTLSRSYAQPFVPRRYATPERDLPARAMPRAPLPDQQTRPDASPGLLRRRYSVPETIMRKYRLAQQRSDSEESGAATHASPASACHSPPREASCSPCDSPHRFIRRDRELMRKSALLRRMWARPCRAPACCCCPDTARETRSLDGSRSELRAPSSSRCPPDRVTAPWTSPKRQRLTAAADLSDSTFQSHRADRNLNYTETPTDVFTDSEASRFGYAVESRNSPPSSERLSEPATAEPESEERSPPDTDPQDAPSFAESDTISASLSTAKETNGSYAPPQGPLSSNGHIEGRVSERSIGVENDDRNLPPYGLPLTIESPAPPYELLEIVVSETLDATISPMPAAKPLGEAVFKNGSALTYFKYGRNLNIDEYVSNILVESLNSLTDQLEFMNASIGGDRKISIVEKEIKVKLQNTGVNTIVHLSPTSNNPIIFGNEELCNEPRRVRDECNNPLSIRDERDHSLESNNNLTSSAGSASRPRSAAAPEPAFEPPLQHDNVNRAVLQQIQKLFRDELRNLDEGEYAADAPPGVSHVEISNVDVYLDNHRAEGAAARGELEIATRADGDLIGGVGTGNYYRDSDEVVTVPRFSAFPHTESMEVNTSSSEDADAAYSDCTSLVDSLDDPNSPRAVLLRRRGDLVRSAVDVLELLPEGARAPTDMRSEAFFIRIEDNERSRHEEGNVKVAEYMPEKIKQKLHRRHRKRELRMECARRSKVKQLKKELEARRHEEMARARREAERECMMIVNALIDDVIAKIAQDELKCMRIKHRNNKMITAKSEENLSKRHRRKDLEAFIDGDDGRSFKNSSTRRSSDKENRKSERHQIRGKLIARPSLASTDRPPRRIYQKSEIHEGEKCIEILEILEYVNGSQSSPETTNSDECHNQNTRCKKSRIPIPVYERIQKTSKSDILQRLTGGDGRHASPPPAGRLLADMLLQALAAEEPQRVLAPAAVPTEPRSRSNSLRFKRVFDIIPEERSSLSFDSSAEDAELARRASAPDVVVPTSIPPPVSAPAADQSPRRGSCTRSAGTSPIADEERTRRLRSQTTMTSPCSKSAATSPLRPPAPAPPHRRPAREGDREKIERAVNPRANISECSRDRTGAGCCGDEESAGSAHAHSRPRRATHPNGVRSKGRVPLPVRTETKACDRRRGSISGEPSRSPDEEDACRKPREERPRGSAGGGGGGSSSDSGDSGGSLLCSLAPRWLSGPARQRRRVRRPAPPAPPAPESPPPRAPPPPLTDREPATNEVYVSKWFAFDDFNFMRDKDLPNETLDTMSENLATAQIAQNNDTGPITPSAMEQEIEPPSDIMNAPDNLRVKKKKKVNAEEDSPMLKKAFQVLTESAASSADPYFSYGQHIANELRKYDSRTLIYVKQAINNVIFDADLGKYSNYEYCTQNYSQSHYTSTPSPQTSTPSSQIPDTTPTDEREPTLLPMDDFFP